MSRGGSMVGGSAATLGDALAAATDALRAAGVDSPRLDAELLLAEATGLGRATLIAEPERPLDGAASRAYGAMVRRRVRREPVAYILGRKGFRRLELRVDGRALIPRPESELLVDLALRERPGSVLDVGTGSGAIALAIADELPGAEVVAVDTSAAALELAGENAARIEAGARVRLELGELPASPPAEGFDLIVANLPYVEAGARGTLAPEISRYEPASALFAGVDGLDAIRGLIARLGPRGASGGEKVGEDDRLGCAAVALEIGAGQDARVAELLAEAGFGSVETIPDLAGIPRVVVGRAGDRGGT